MYKSIPCNQTVKNIELSRLIHVYVQKMDESKVYLQSSQFRPPNPGGQLHLSGKTHRPCPQPPVHTAKHE